MWKCLEEFLGDNKQGMSGEKKSHIKGHLIYFKIFLRKNAALRIFMCLTKIAEK